MWMGEKDMKEIKPGKYLNQRDGNQVEVLSISKSVFGFSDTVVYKKPNSEQNWWLSVEMFSEQFRRLHEEYPATEYCQNHYDALLHGQTMDEIEKELRAQTDEEGLHLTGLREHIQKNFDELFFPCTKHKMISMRLYINQSDNVMNVCSICKSYSYITKQKMPLFTPCTICTSLNIQYRRVNNKHWIECIDCGLRSSFQKSPSEAIKVWLG